MYKKINYTTNWEMKKMYHCHFYDKYCFDIIKFYYINNKC